MGNILSIARIPVSSDSRIGLRARTPGAFTSIALRRLASISSPPSDALPSASIILPNNLKVVGILTTVPVLSAKSL
jgi:hypothetical protein